MSHYYDNEQDSALEVKKIDIRILGNKLKFEVPSGVFSKKKLDKGTEILINHADIEEGDKILDMGCGWGPIGISLSKEYKCKTTMVDINKRAVQFARRNAFNNEIDARVFVSNIYEKVEGKYDVILSNIPQSAGKEICFKIIEGAKEHLKKDGSLQIVVRKNKGGRIIEEKLREVFSDFIVLAKKGGYWVYKAIN